MRRVEHQIICDKMMKPAIHFTTIVAVVNVVMGMAFTLLTIPEMIYHYTITGEWVRQLPFLIWWPFDPYSGFVYLLMYPLYIVIGFCAIIIHMVISTVALVVIFYPKFAHYYITGVRLFVLHSFRPFMCAFFDLEV